MRAFPPESLARAATRQEGTRTQSPLHPANGLYVVDSELGYRPRLGSALADSHGCMPNDYPFEKTPGQCRVLFIGDSVTKRGALVRGLKGVWGDQGIEYWNAGVEGYALRQIDRYYARYLTELNADHVILTFHLNDFSTTPVLFQDGDRLVVLTTDLTNDSYNRWLFQHSYLYRFWLSRRLSKSIDEENEPSQALVHEVERALVDLSTRVESKGARFSVILFPWLAEPAEWPAHIIRAHEQALAMLQRNHIRYFDPVPILEEALAQGEIIRQRPKDPQHPSDAFGARLARAFVKAGFDPR